jgi:signal transduction histidine kinase
VTGTDGRIPDPTNETTPSARDALEALGDAAGAVAGVLDAESVLQLIVDRVRGLVGARYAALGTVGERRGIESFITSGISAAERARIGPPPEGHGLLGLIIREGRAFRVPDIAAHPASHGFPPHHPPMRSLLGVPVRVRNRTIGNLYLTDKIGAAEFSEDDQRLVELFAIHAGIAIEHARLHEAVQRLAVVDERDRIGKDLHDGIIQSLYGIALSLEDVPDMMSDQPEEASARVDRAIDAVNRTIGDLRGFIVGLHSDLIDRTDMIELLRALALEVGEHADLSLEVELTEAPLDLTAHARSELLQIAREALANVARHARATIVRITLAREGDVVRLEIVDDGRGFDSTEATRIGHFGLANMRDRAAALGGRLDLESRQPGGTRIIVTVPTAGSTAARPDLQPEAAPS